MAPLAFLLSVLGLTALALADNSMNVLVNSNTLFNFLLPDGTTGSVEEYCIRAFTPYTPVLISDSQWGSLTAADFAGYRAIVLGDPNCEDIISA